MAHMADQMPLILSQQLDGRPVVRRQWDPETPLLDKQSL